MNNKIIAIGALGGSGTRAVAEVFINLGLYMGDDLNNSNDNLLFTKLFKNPKWYQQTSIEEKELRLRIFKKYMSGDNLDDVELKELYHAIETNKIDITDLSSYKEKFKSLYEKRVKRNVWGWKEPNTQIFTSEILDYFPKFKYIHILRHGLDMAFSQNIQQLKNWGWKYGLELSGTETDNEIAVKQLDFWIESTKDILLKKSKFTDRILIVNHSNFCEQPKMAIDKMLDFCDIKLPSELLDEIYKIPKDTGSNSRYKSFNLDIFGEEKLEFVRQNGFKIRTTPNNE